MTAALGCVEHRIPLEEDGSCKECKRLLKAKAATETVLRGIESLTEDKQQRVLECGMRMRELACFYGPYFKYAIALTSCEIASGALIMPLEAECDRIDIMLPGGKAPEDLQKLIIPGAKH